MDMEQMILYPQFNKNMGKTFDGGDEKARRNAQYFAKMFLYIYAGR